MKRLLSLLIFLLIPAICSAATVYLDIAATGCTGGGQANANYNPSTRSCGSGTDKVYAGNFPFEASQSLSSGDTLYIRAGTYYEDITGKPDYEWNRGAIFIQNTNVANVTIQNYNGETVTISGGPSLTNVTGHSNNPVALYGSNIIFDGIHVYGCILLGGTGNRVQNCDLSGGWDHQSPIGGDPWADVIRFEGATNATVQNCNIHDNYQVKGINENQSFMMHENDENTIVQNCNFYNPVAGWVYTKYGRSGGTIQATYRYNFFEKAVSNPFTGTSAYYGQDVKVYQNIMIGSGSAGDIYFYLWNMDKQHFKIYNNTFYNVTSALYSWSGGDANAHQFYNNIVYADSGTKYGVNYKEVYGSIAGNYIDDNDYYQTGSGAVRWGYYNTTYNTLSAWTAAQGYDSHSVTTNPGFLNASGTFGQPTDFKRSSYSDGRGAYMTGNEIIGSLTGKIPTGKRPSPPQNLR